MSLLDEVDFSEVVIVPEDREDRKVLDSVGEMNIGEFRRKRHNPEVCRYMELIADGYGCSEACSLKG